MIYKLNAAKITFREYLFEGILLLPLAFLAFLLYRVFRLKYQDSIDIPPVNSLRDFVVLDEMLSDAQRNAIWPVAEKLYDSGFRISIPYRFVSPLQNCCYTGLMLVDEAGTTLAWLRYREASNLRARWKQPVLSLFSIRKSGGEIMTNACHPEVLTPEDWLVNYFPGQDLQQLIVQHQQACQQATDGLKSFRIERDVVKGFDEILASYADFQIKRGVFFEDDETRELSQMAEQGMLSGASQEAEDDETNADHDTLVAELAEDDFVAVNGLVEAAHPSAKADSSVTSVAKKPEMESDLVVREVRNLEKANSGWVGKLTLLIVSVVAFVALGAFAWEWNFILYLLPILFVHELGHYVAMKCLGYRNIKMFFLPLFGAAVSGQNFGAAGWKKSVVALAGPVPSIVIALVLGFVGWFYNWQWAHYPVAIALLLNIMNLLPLLPFDGGWVAHNTIFCRTPVLEIVFRVIAGILLLGLGLISGAWVIACVAVALLLAIPSRWKLLKIAERLKPELGSSAESESIPVNSIRRISSELQNSDIKIFQPKQLAQLVVQVHEDIVARPPSALASTLLLLGHGAALIGGLFLGLVLIFLNKTSLFQNMPEYKTTRVDVPVVTPILKSGDNQTEASEQILVMQFEDESQAAAEFQARSSRSDNSVSLVKNVLFQTIKTPVGKEESPTDLGNLLDPRWHIEREEAARKRPELKPETTTPVQSRVLENFPVLTVRFSSQEQRQKVLETIDSVQEIPGRFLPPWKKKLDPAGVELLRVLNLVHGNGDSIPWIKDDEEPESAETFDGNEEFDEEKYRARENDNRIKRKAWLENELQSASGPVREIFEKSLQSISEDDEASSYGDMEMTWSLLSPEVRKLMGEVGPDHSEYRHSLNGVYNSLVLEDLKPNEESSAQSTSDRLDEGRFANYTSIEVTGVADSAVLISDLIEWLKESGAEEIRLSWDAIDLPE